jgi:dipeptidyl-peptidase-4
VGPGGAQVLFLRSDGPTDPVNHLWLAERDSGGWVQTRLADAGALLEGAAEELPAAERARRERLRETSGGITAYSTDRWLRRICFVLGGRLFCHDRSTGTTRRLGVESGLANPAIDPTGRRIATTRGGELLLVDADSGQARVLLTPNGAQRSWGSAEFIAAEEMDRSAGLWWAPDGESLLVQESDDADVGVWHIADPAHPAREPLRQRYPAAGTANTAVRLHVVELDGSTREVRWDREGFEYLARVHWSQHGDPIAAVQNRDQSVLRVLEIGPATGRTTLLAQDARQPWVELVPGAPRRTAEGLATVAVDRAGTTRRLHLHAAAGVMATPAGIQVVAVTGDDDSGITFVGHDGDPATRDVWRMAWDGSVRRISDPGRWTTGVCRDGTAVLQWGDPAAPVSTMTIRTHGPGSGAPPAAQGDHTPAPADTRTPAPGSAPELAKVRWTDRAVDSLAEVPDVLPRPQFIADGGWNRIAVLLPSTTPHGPLPIIMSPYGGPHSGRSIKAAAAFLVEQWLADQGFCVVVADGPGSPSDPVNEAAIHLDLAAGALAGQVSALDRVTAEFGEAVDPGRVGIRGWSFGGYLAALAVLDRPDLFHAAVSGAPVTDWSLYDTHYTERYLGTPAANAAAYERSSLIARAAQLARPLLLIHGLADDNVVAAHTLRLSATLLAKGRGHCVLPLAGVTHMTPQEDIAENLLRAELEFFRSHLQR